MICMSCRKQKHEICLAEIRKSPTWCDCQHKSMGINKGLVKRDTKTQ
jgi:hypothetical protein